MADRCMYSVIQCSRVILQLGWQMRGRICTNACLFSNKIYCDAFKISYAIYNLRIQCTARGNGKVIRHKNSKKKVGRHISMES